MERGIFCSRSVPLLFRLDLTIASGLVAFMRHDQNDNNRRQKSSKDVFLVESRYIFLSFFASFCQAARLMRAFDVLTEEDAFITFQTRPGRTVLTLFYHLETAEGTGTFSYDRHCDARLNVDLTRTTSMFVSLLRIRLYHTESP